MTPRIRLRLPSLLRKRITCPGTGRELPPLTLAPPPYVGQMSTYGSSTVSSGSLLRSGMRWDGRPSFSTNRFVFSVAEEK